VLLEDECDCPTETCAIEVAMYLAAVQRHAREPAGSSRHRTARGISLDAQASVPRERWWTPLRRPSAWIAILGFAVLNVVALDLGLPTSGRRSSPVRCSRPRWRSSPNEIAVAPIVVFLAVLATHAAFRLGGLPAFLAFEGVLILLAAVAIWRRRRSRIA